MEIEQHPDRFWWIIGIPDTITECGPYATRAEAESDRRGMARFFQHEHDQAWFDGNGQSG